MTQRLRYRVWKLRALMWLLRRLRKGRGPERTTMPKRRDSPRKNAS
ncbi:MAG: hypothetical protein WA624_07130 [Methylocella sp.]